MMTTPFSASLVASGICYIAQKSLSFCCTSVNPVEARVSTIFESFRNACADMKESLANLLGQKGWKLTSEVIFENAWISTFVVTFLILTTSAPMSLALSFELATIFLVVALQSWIIRLGITHYLPDISFFIACLLDPSISGAIPKELYIQLARRLLQDGINGPIAADPRLDLIGLLAIPPELRSDPCFTEHICPITRLPIRFPVRDIIGGLIYDSAAVLHFADNPQQGFPHIRFERNQLVQLQLLRGVIESRLRYHEELLRKIAAEELN